MWTPPLALSRIIEMPCISHGPKKTHALQVRDPRSAVVFSKLELNDAELNFKNKVAGLHTFCIKLSNKSKTHSDTISSPRVKRQLRTVTIDVQTRGAFIHDRVREDDVTDLLQEVSDVQLRVQVSHVHCCVK